MKQLIEPPSWDKYYEWVDQKFDPDQVLTIAIKQEFEEDVIALGYKKPDMHQIPGTYDRGTYEIVDGLIHIEHNIGSNWTEIEDYDEKVLPLLRIKREWVDFMSFYD